MGFFSRLLGAKSAANASAREDSVKYLDALIETSWSGKAGHRYFDPHGGIREPSVGKLRRQQEAPAPPRARHGSGGSRSAGRLQRQHHNGTGGAAAAGADAARVGARPAAPVAVAGADAAGELPEGSPATSLAAAAVGAAAPKLGSSPARAAIHRSGSAPCTIDMAKQTRQAKDAARDSASSIHSPICEGGLAPPLAAAAPASAPPKSAPPRAAKPAQAGRHPIAALQEQQQRQPTASAAPVSVAAPARNLAEEESSPEKPSQGILVALSRSLPGSREPSVHGGSLAHGAYASVALAPAAAGKQQPQQGEAGQGGGDAAAADGSMHSGRSGSGRPRSRPISMPGSAEPTQHGRHDAAAALGSLPPGLPAEAAEADFRRQALSVPAHGELGSSYLCSPGAVSLLSLQLRGPSAGGSGVASREGSFRPLHRQLSAGGLSAALSREGSTRRGAGASREGSSRGLTCRVPNPAGGAAAGRGGGQPWSPVRGSREASGREPLDALNHEGSTGRRRRGTQAAGGALAALRQSREGSSRGGSDWALLHPVAEAGPYRPVPLPAVRLSGELAGSWVHRVTSYAPTTASGAGPVPGAGLGPGPDRSTSTGSSRRRESSRRQQQRYSVDPNQLTAALSAIAIRGPASTSPPSPAAAAAAAAATPRASAGPSEAARAPAPKGGEQGAAAAAALATGALLRRQPSLRGADAGGSPGASSHGQRNVLVGDPEWATQLGDHPSLLPQGDPLTGSGAALPALAGESGGGGAAGAAQQANHPGEWNRTFIKRWKAVKKRARIQAMGLRSLWKVNSPSDRHPDELLVDLPENDPAYPRYWSPSKARPRAGPQSPPLPGGVLASGASAAQRGVPVGRGARRGLERDPSLSVLLLGEVAEVT